MRGARTGYNLTCTGFALHPRRGTEAALTGKIAELNETGGRKKKKKEATLYDKSLPISSAQ